MHPKDTALDRRKKVIQRIYQTHFLDIQISQFLLELYLLRSVLFELSPPAAAAFWSPFEEP
jgi:hypothetical protein